VSAVREPLDHRLLPRTAALDAGRLTVGGISAETLAARHGTPLIVFDEDDLRYRCRAALAAFGPDQVTYASKAFLCRAMARLVSDEGLLLDVASGGELQVALDAGVPASRIVVHGNNKSSAELAEAMTAGVRHLVVDNFDEIERIEKLGAEGLGPIAVQLRIAPGVGVGSHDAIRTGQLDSKFGFPLVDGIAEAAVAAVRESSTMRWHGVHAHAGSQVLDVYQLVEFARASAAFAVAMDAPALTLGGGLGIAYLGADRPADFAEWRAALASGASAAGWHGPFVVEPGRAIAGPAALTLYTVGVIKDIPGVRRYLAVDGGMSDHPRPAMYGSKYEAFLPRAADAVRPEPYRIVGKHCESGDLVVDEAWLPEGVRVGDVVAVPVTGAYGYSMASNYNRLPRPEVVFVSGGVSRTVLRRETPDDLARLDVFEPDGAQLPG
jgi:diaminopimelate decarboxylase